MRSRLLGRTPKFFESLADVLGNCAQPFATLAIDLACNALQLGRYPILLRGRAFIVCHSARSLGCPPLILGAPALVLRLVVVAGFVAHLGLAYRLARPP